MTDDPIVAEVRSLREALARDCGQEVARIFAALRERQRRPDPDHPVLAPGPSAEDSAPAPAVEQAA